MPGIQCTGVGVGGGPMRTAREGWHYFPPKDEAPLHDHDGNLTSDARWLYRWDAENRLTAMEEKAGAAGPGAAGSPKRQRLEFAYDGESRRVRKRVLEWSVEMNSWVLRRDVRFLYDGWSMIAEFEAQGSGASSTLALAATYAWGLDFGGTETGAGGVGGLLFVSLYSTTTTQTTVNNSQPPPTSILAPCYDGNGNVLAYVDTVSGAVVARYEYDPFGQVMVREEAASVAGRLHHQFSTKYTDSETGLVYYGFRYYSPELGRWPNKDPIGERGGINVYQIAGNSTLNNHDYLGLKACGGCGTSERRAGRERLFEIATKYKHETAGWSCIDTADWLLGRIDIPPSCWECRVECRLKIPAKSDANRAQILAMVVVAPSTWFRHINHCVVMCQSRDESGTRVEELLLDNYRFPSQSPSDFRRENPYLQGEDYEPYGRSPWIPGPNGGAAKLRL